MDRRRWIAVALFLSAWAVFGQAVTFDFVNLDDKQYVTQNEQVLSGLTVDGIGWSFTTGHAGNWHPLTWLTHMLDVSLWGEGPAGHHATNILIHGLNAAILFLVLHAMTGRLWPSVFVAALFAVHPLRVESVAWVSERKDVLCALFGLLCLGAYARYVRQGGTGRYLLVALFLGLGLMAKPMLVTWPFLLLLIDRWPLERREPWRRLVMEKLPLVALVVVSSFVTFWVQRGGGAVAESGLLPLGDRLANAVVAYVRYIGLTIFPQPLAVYYTHPSLPGGTPLELWQIGGALAILLSLTGLAWRFRARGYPWLGWCWFVGTLVPVIGIVQVGIQALADRYSYLPSIGLYIVAVFALAEFARSRQSVAVDRALAAVGLLVVVSFAALAFTQTRVWRDSETLARHGLTVSPQNAVLNYTLAEALADRGQTDEAVDAYRRTVGIDPGYAEAHNNLGNLLRDRGEPAEAARHFRSAIEVDPELAAAHNNLGTLLAQAGRFDEALTRLQQAVALEPANHEVRFNLGLAHQLAGNVEAAREEYRRVLELEPGYARAQAALDRLPG